MNDKNKQITNMTTFESSTEYNYGQFVMLSEHNEIMRYSRNGNAIYYTQDPPASPVKQKINNSKLRMNENESIPKYPQCNNMYSKVNTHTVELLYGVLAVIFFLIIFTSFYILFFDTTY